jgi:outer membrane immunogenic protein
MKKLFLGGVALLALGSAAATAADLPARRAPPAPYVAVPVFTWAGFYVGVNAGYGFDAGDNRNNGPFAVGPGGTTPAGVFTPGSTVITRNNGGRDGFVGGGQIGYNYQIGSIVFGIEADAQYADLAGTPSAVTAFGPASGLAAPFIGLAPAGGNRTGVEWFGTVRGRLGYAFDRALIYGTGGFAYGDGPDNCNSVQAPALAAAFPGRAARCTGDIRTGWAAGGGVEYAFTPNVSAKVEALYVSLGGTNASRFVGDAYTAAGGAPTQVFLTRRARDDDFVVVRAGLNWKFNSFLGL